MSETHQQQTPGDGAATTPAARREAAGEIDGREAAGVMNRREAVRRVTALLGGVALVGGSSLLAACERERARGADGAARSGDARIGDFTAQDVALLDEVADTILPDTERSPGAKAAKVGAFMALMVTDTYDPSQRQVFRDGMRKVDEASRAANNVGFMQATPAQRLALLERLDREQKTYMDALTAAGGKAKSAEAERPTEQAPQGGAGGARRGVQGADTGALARSAGQGTEAEKHLQGDPRQQSAVGSGAANPAPAMTADAPPHYFRMMKELALLGYFTSEIGYTKAMRYVESPGRYDPCAPYAKGETAWAPHA
jgi:hypothetical protein